MSNSFSAVSKNTFSRKWAGSDASAVDPYISGYFFTHFAKVPDLGSFVKTGSTSALNDRLVKDVLKGACLAVTIPGGTVNRAEFTGLGGVRWAVPTNVEFDNTVTFRFLEFATLPVFDILHAWVRMMRDYQYGTSDMPTYTKSAYAGTAYYWTTQPDGKTIEYYACLSGLFPLKDPTDQYGGDLTAYDKLEIDVDFNCDYIWHEPWVKTNIGGYLPEGKNEITTKYDQGK